MTTDNPLSDPLFLRTAGLLVLAFLILTGGALVRQWRRRRHPEERALLVPVGTAAVVTILLLLALFGGGVALLVLTGVLTVAALIEYTRVVALERDYRLVLIGWSLGCLVVAAFALRIAVLLAPLGLFLVLTLIPILSRNVEGAHRQIGVSLFGYLYIGLPLAYLVFIRAAEPWGLQLLLVTCVSAWLADSCAYIVGSKLGGPKLAPTVSPGKTWSGAIGGVAGAIAGILVMRGLLPLQWTAAQLAPLALAAAVTAVWGDLIESVVKRDFMVKDAGTILPGFGGVLDRFDSMLVSIPAAYYLVLGARHVGH
jgi:phosphatidate cytidylyltransferase